MAASPSQCIASFIMVSTLTTFLACLLSALVLFLAPEEPWRLGYTGGPFALYVAIALVIVAVLSIFMGVLGCCGVIKDSRTILLLFSVCVVIVAALEVASSGVLLGFSYSYEVHDNMKNDLIGQIEHYNTSSNSSAIDDLQRKYKCCGVFNYTDWMEWGNFTHPPLSCCESKYSNQSNCTLYDVGCLSMLLKNFHPAAYTVFIVTVLSAFLLLLASCVSCCGSFHIHKYKDYDVL